MHAWTDPDPKEGAFLSTWMRLRLRGYSPGFPKSGHGRIMHSDDAGKKQRPKLDGSVSTPCGAAHGHSHPRYVGDFKNLCRSRMPYRQGPFSFSHESLEDSALASRCNNHGEARFTTPTTSR